MKLVSRKVLMLAAALPTCGMAQAADPGLNTIIETAALIRQIDLTEIGYPAGLEFEQLSGEAVAFFPVGAREAIKGMVLRLDIVHGQTLDVAKHVKISVNDVIAHAEALPADHSRSTIELKLPPEAAQGGFVKIGLAYGGASSDNICFDERSSGDFVQFLPRSSLTLALNREALNTIDRVAQVMPPAKILKASGNAPITSALPFALRAAALYDAEYGFVTIGRPDEADGPKWTVTKLALGELEGESGAGAVAVSRAEKPGLTFDNEDPEIGLALAASRWRALTGATGAATDVALPPGRSAEAITFAQLGAPEMRQQVIGSSMFQFGFSADDFGAGKLPTNVELLVGAARSPNGRGVTVTAYLNGTLLGSRPLDEAEPVWMEFAIPSGLVGRENQMQILVQRQVEGGNCLFTPQGYPAQVLPQSRFTLGDAPKPSQDFFLMRQTFAGGVDLVVEPGTEVKSYLPWLIPIAGALLPDAANITMREDMSAAGGEKNPFLYVGKAAPPGADPDVRFDQGRMEIRDSAGETLFASAAMEETAVVQIVEIGDRAGIWLRPGTAPAPSPTRETPLLLDRGNLAFIDESGLIFATSTKRSELVDISYPDRTDITQVVAAYRPWIIGTVWLALTLLVVRSLQTVYHKNRRGKES